MEEEEEDEEDEDGLLEVVGSLFRLWETRIFAGIPQALEVEAE